MKQVLSLCLVLMIPYLFTQKLAADSKVFITSEPNGASVLWDGNPLGKTPLLGLEVNVGTYKLEFRLDGYQSQIYNLQVKSDGLDYPVNVKLDAIPKTGTLRIESQPSGAVVYINGSRKPGTTPVTIRDLTAGGYEVRVEKSGYESAYRSIPVRASQSEVISFSLVRIPPKYGSIQVKSQPNGATVYLNGTRQSGNTPTVIPDLSAGNYSVGLEKSGYQTATRRISVTAGKKEIVSVSLNPIIIPSDTKSAKDTPKIPLSQLAETQTKLTEKAKLSAISLPSGSTVYLDNTIIGRTPLDQQVSPGPHTIRIISTGYKDWSEIRSFNPGETVNVDARLIYIGSGGGGGGGRATESMDPMYIIIGVVAASTAVVAVTLILLLRRRKAATVVSPVSSSGFAGGQDITPHLSTGAIFGDYHLLGRIGQGGMAVVYKARHRQRPGELALKVPFQNMIHEEEFVNRFLRQAEIGAQLSHPRIVNIIDSGSVDGVPYLAMEYIQGGDLRKRINQYGRLPISQAVKYAIQVCEALDYVHLL